MRRGRHALALESFEHIISLDPRHPGAWHGIGLAQRDLGNAEESLTALLNAVQYEPMAINQRIDAAAALLETDPKLALELVQAGAAMHPNDVRLSKAVKVVQARLGQ